MAQYSERAPDAAELFSKGGHHATGTFEVGNPFLGKEKAFTIEAGLAKATGPFRFDATAFHTSYRGFIYRQLAGAECEGAAHGGHYHCEEHEGGDDHGHEAGAEGEHAHAYDLVFFRQRDARFYGVELAAQYDVAPIWNGVWASMAATTSSMPGSRAEKTFPASRLTGWVAGCTTGMPTGSPARASCRPSIRTGSASMRSKHPVTPWSRRN